MLKPPDLGIIGGIWDRGLSEGNTRVHRTALIYFREQEAMRGWSDSQIFRLGVCCGHLCLRLGIPGLSGPGKSHS